MSTISGTSSRIDCRRCFSRPPSVLARSHSFFVLDHVEHGMGGGDADRVAAIGAAEAAGAGRIHDLGAAGDGCEREAAGQALGHGGDVGATSW
jgi:hypothetical protein